MSDVRFEKVDRSEVPEINHHPNQPSALVAALAAGDAVFVEGKGRSLVNSLRARGRYLDVNGFRVHSRTGERNGKPGVFIWAERFEHPRLGVLDISKGAR